MLLHHFHKLHAERDEHFGNARLVRNCFEQTVNTQASRLAANPEPEPNALVNLIESDLDSPARSALDAYRKQQKHYIIRCPECTEKFSWTPDISISEAECTQCQKIHNCEFGELID